MDLRFEHAKDAGFHGSGIPRGKDVEYAILNACRIPPKEWSGEYMPFDDSVALCKKHQPDIMKRSQTVKRFRQMVVDQVSNTHEPVKCYIAVGSPLDLYHGVDAFFEQDGRRVTIDLTLRDKSSSKADVVLRVDMDEEGHIEIAPEELESAARKCALLLQSPATQRRRAA